MLFSYHTSFILLKISEVVLTSKMIKWTHHSLPKKVKVSYVYYKPLNSLGLTVLKLGSYIEQINQE